MAQRYTILHTRRTMLIHPQNFSFIATEQQRLQVVQHRNDLERIVGLIGAKC